MSVKISIIIPTYNEEEYLPRLLESIQKQTFQDYEIIVADNKSRDQTRKIAKSFGARVVDGGMPSRGRNNGAKAARGDFLYFFDADIKLPKDFLKKSYNEIQDRFLDVASCEFRPLSNMLLDRVIHSFANFYVKMNQVTDPHAPGFCIFISRRLFERIGGFNEKLKLAEDHDLVKRASEFRSFRILESSHIQVSVRRFRKEGRLLYIGKVMQVTWHRAFKGEVTEQIVDYEFGNFDRNPKGAERSKLLKLEQEINRLDKKYSSLVSSYRKKKKDFHSGEIVDRLQEQYASMKEKVKEIF